MVTTSNVHFQILKPSFETLGVVVDYLSKSPGFADYEFGAFTKIIQHQLATSCHLVAVRSRSLVGYTGWIHTTADNGNKWLEDNVELHPVDARSADAAALTIVAIEERAILLPMIRHLRKKNPHKRVFFKREYPGGQKAARKNTVFNAAQPG